MNGGAESNTAFSVKACAALFALEACYVFFLYDPSTTRTQAGLMLIFAAEAGYFLKIANAQLKEKKSLGKVSLHSRLYAVAFFLPLLAAMTISITSWHPAQAVWLIVLLLFAEMCGKIAWYRDYLRRSIKGAR
jgi:DMSO reductase anchor subunit